MDLPVRIKLFTTIMKLTFMVLALCVFFVISSCSNDNSVNINDEPLTGTFDESITYDGVTRNYILYVPDNYSAHNPVPLIFNFHGWTQYNFMYINQSDFRPIADTAGFILVYPQGIKGADNNPFWNTDLNQSPDDIGFTEAMIDDISSRYNIDAARIYATGYSNGAYLSYALACFLNNRIAAIAPVKGSMYDWMTSNYNVLHPTPILAINNTSDTLVPYAGNMFSHPVEDAVQFWRGINNCNLIADTTRFPDIDPGDGIEVERLVYDNGNSGAKVELIIEIDSSGRWGHSYPVSRINSPGYFHAPDEIWNFFSNYDINGLME